MGDLIVKKILQFRILFLAFLVILSLSSVVHILSQSFPFMLELLATSPQTPWGVVTSIFSHLNDGHLLANMAGLLSAFAFFFMSNVFLSKEERNHRIRFILVVSFSSAILCNVLFVVITPQYSSTGASGLVYGSEGIVTGLSLLNSFNIFDLRRYDEKRMNPLFFVYLYNAGIFLLFIVGIILNPALFLGVGQNVNVFTHGVSFVLSLILTVFVYARKWRV